MPFEAVCKLKPMGDEKPTDLADSDWDNRVLCSDDNCIGVIGPDGRCKECGLTLDPSARPAVDRTDGQPQADAVQSEQPPPAAADPIAPPDTDDDDWDNRVLCSDGNCIGVIGPDGRCKECGRKADA
jgi:hypothetical protein